ncbi:NTP transferase domain-containing protein [Candidatus Saccharibacteria bacterium]|nr:NTP transferase domain-containing protein [Candidatus Saccharibacteria bacterium]MCB9834943.1 NTP transferase domain-containing protein [Candidatus Nomurabacteria bacterium]
MKGLIAAGGQGTRLGELTRVTNKHMLPVADLPMIYYPLQTLSLGGISKIMIVTGKDHAGDFVNLLGSGKIDKRFYETDQDRNLFELDLTYKVQTKPQGLAQVVGMAQDFVSDGEKFAFILGDNIVENSLDQYFKEFEALPMGSAMVFFSEVTDPERFGVPRFNQNDEVVEIIEKPGKLNPGPPPSNYAQIGVYLFDSTVFDLVQRSKPSQRGEYEITDLINPYIAKKSLHHRFIKGWWQDVGTIQSLSNVGQLIAKTGANNQPN